MTRITITRKINHHVQDNRFHDQDNSHHDEDNPFHDQDNHDNNMIIHPRSVGRFPPLPSSRRAAAQDSAQREGEVGKTNTKTYWPAGGGRGQNPENTAQGQNATRP